MKSQKTSTCTKVMSFIGIFFLLAPLQLITARPYRYYHTKSQQPVRQNVKPRYTQQQIDNEQNSNSNKEIFNSKSDMKSEYIPIKTNNNSVGYKYSNILKNRIVVYKNDTLPVLKYYRDLNKLNTVDGMQSIEKVSEDILKLLT